MRRWILRLAASAAGLALLVPAPAGAGDLSVFSARFAGERAQAKPRALCRARTGELRCLVEVLTVRRSGRALAAALPFGLGPEQIRAAYGLPSSASAPVTVAIPTVGDPSGLEADLALYSDTFGLPACSQANGCLVKLNQDGSASPLPQAADDGWATEAALDVEAVHAVCPNCKIMLLAATSAAPRDVGAAVLSAVRLGATVVSASYGGDEFLPDHGVYDQPGVAIVAASGDDGWGISFPAALPSVISVGGTSLTVTGGPGAYGYGGETVWAGTGSGCSPSYLFGVAPGWQSADAAWKQTGCGRQRAANDVAAVADPATGAAIAHDGSWLQVGGTSLSAPLVAGMFALAGGPRGVAYPAQTLYRYRAAVHDVTSGSNGPCGTIMCNAADGWDGPTGLGTPSGLALFGEGAAPGAPSQNTIAPVALPFSTSGRILFTSDSENDGLSVFAISPEGTGAIRIAAGADPAFSPDRSAIAFRSRRDGNDELYRMAADGSGLARLTTSGATDAQPAFSPDGRLIAFASDRDGNFEVYVMNNDGSGVRRLTSTGRYTRNERPAWSADGKTIAFERTTASGVPQIDSVRAAGGRVRRLTTRGWNSNPRFSPDGRWIVFSSNRDGNDQIYVMRSDGSAQTRLTRSRAADRMPAFSPDGTRIVFARSPTGQDADFDLYVMGSRGTAVRRLASLPGFDSQPDW